MKSAGAVPGQRRQGWFDGRERARVSLVGKIQLEHARRDAAVTSCTNTSNPALMLAAGLLAKKAVERGSVPPW